MEKIYEEEVIGFDQFVGDVFYYGDSYLVVVQFYFGEDVWWLLNDYCDDGKLIVFDVGLKYCGLCVKVYLMVVKLFRRMDMVVFVRMNGDENESCM